MVSFKVPLFRRREKGQRANDQAVFGKCQVPRKEPFQGSGAGFCESSLFGSMTVGANQT